MVLRRLAIISGILFVVWAIAELAAIAYLNYQFSTGWPIGSGSLRDVPAAFPPRATNPAARQLETEAAGIGIDLVPHSGRRGLRAGFSDAEWKTAQEEIKSYIREKVQNGRANLSLPDGRAAAYLSRHGAAIRDIAVSIVAGEQPTWNVDVRRGFDAPIPNLLGHLALSRVLVAHALCTAAEGQRDAAWNDLRAAASFADTLRERPELISHLIAYAEGTLVIGAMRQIDGNPPDWALAWPATDLKRDLDRAVAFEAYALYRPFTGSPAADLFTSFSDGEGRPTLGGRLLSLILGPYLRASAGNAASHQRRIVEAYGWTTGCAAVESKSVPNTVPQWNVFGRVAIPAEALRSSYDRLPRLRAHIEGTHLILAARRARFHSSSWPAEAPAVSPCTLAVWTYEVTPTGELHVAARKPIAIQKTTGAINLAQDFRER